MLQLMNREAVVAGENPGRTQRPTLCLTWELDPHSGRPVGRWIIEGTKPASLRLAVAA
jgi:hypothetical protein